MDFDRSDIYEVVEELIKQKEFRKNIFVINKNYSSYEPKNLSSKNMECLTQKGLYFIGESVDVTGELGGYNLHWCFASAWAVAKSINA